MENGQLDEASIHPPMSETTVTENALDAGCTPNRDLMRRIIGLSLWTGQMLLQNGASSLRTEESIHRVGTGLGADWMDIFVSTDAITVTATADDDFRTKTRRIVRIGVNMDRVTALSDLGHDVRDGLHSADQVEARLERIDTLPRLYHRLVTVFLVGLACAAFSRLFGGDWPAFGVTLVAASAAMFARQTITARHFNPYLMVTMVAFIGGFLASFAILFTDAANTNTAIVSAVLLLVPGVPLINSVQDLIRGYTGNGIRRGMEGLIISFAIALGLVIAIQTAGVVLP